MNSTFRPAFLLMAGRVAGALAGFAVPLVLVRIFEPGDFGTYKQLFLIYVTLYGAAQLGMAESLFYFLPQDPRSAGRYLANSILALVGAGMVCLGLLVAAGPAVSGLMNNPDLGRYLPLLGAYLALMIASALAEIALISRGRCLLAAVSYAGSDVARAALYLAPVIFFRDLRWLLFGAVAFAAARLACVTFLLHRTFGRDLRPDARLLARQVAYALPFAVAVGLHAAQENFHQYAISSRFDAATFAIYAVGCLQIPFVDFLSTSASSVMMVRMSEELRSGRTAAVLAIWHDAARKLALVFCPLVGLLVACAPLLVTVLFTEKFAASTPLFMVWSLVLLSAVIQIDGALRVYADTRFLMIMNILRLALIVVLIHPAISAFGLMGAVLVALAATFGGKLIALIRIKSLMGIGVRRLLPWGALAGTAAASGMALAAGLAVRSALVLPAWPSLVVTGGVYAVCCAALLLVFGLLPPSLAGALRGRLARPLAWAARLGQTGTP